MRVEILPAAGREGGREGGTSPGFFVAAQMIWSPLYCSDYRVTSRSDRPANTGRTAGPRRSGGRRTVTPCWSSAGAPASPLTHTDTSYSRHSSSSQCHQWRYVRYLTISTPHHTTPHHLSKEETISTSPLLSLVVKLSIRLVELLTPNQHKFLFLSGPVEMSHSS